MACSLVASFRFRFRAWRSGGISAENSERVTKREFTKKCRTESFAPSEGAFQTFAPLYSFLSFRRNLKNVYRDTRGINRSGFKPAPIDATTDAFSLA